MSDRALVYQAAHGLGVELYVVHTSARLASLLDRRLVLPRLPVLETHRYPVGLEQCFSLPDGVHWMSTGAFEERYGAVIDQVFHLVPNWRADYRSAENRHEHPVWVATIDRCEYFAQLGFGAHRTVRYTIDRPLTDDEARQRFASDEPVIGVSYLHGLLDEEEPGTTDPDDHFMGRTFTPPAPHPRFAELVRRELGRAPDVAIHARTGILEISREVNRTALPDLDAYWKAADGDGLVYIATDADRVFEIAQQRFPTATRLVLEDPVEDAVLDMASCIEARRFVGTHASTFSHYVAHARMLAGKPRADQLLL